MVKSKESSEMLFSPGAVSLWKKSLLTVKQVIKNLSGPNTDNSASRT